MNNLDEKVTLKQIEIMGRGLARLTKALMPKCMNKDCNKVGDLQDIGCRIMWCTD